MQPSLPYLPKGVFLSIRWDNTYGVITKFSGSQGQLQVSRDNLRHCLNWRSIRAGYALKLQVVLLPRWHSCTFLWRLGPAIHFWVMYASCELKLQGKIGVSVLLVSVSYILVSMSRDKRLIKYLSWATEMLKTIPRTQLLQKVGFCFRENLPQRNMERRREL